MPTLTCLSAADLRQAVLRFRDALRAHQEELNRLNVYPVPDGDTGTNMALTLESVSAELQTAESMDEVCHAVSRGSLMGARGNSGVITSQILRGLVEGFRALDASAAADLRAGLRRGTDAAYQAVMRPVEGTILTVVRESAEAVEALGGDPTLDDAARARLRRVVRRRSSARPSCSRRCATRASSTRAARASRCCSRRCCEVVSGTPIPEPEIVTAPAVVTAHLAGDDLSSLRYEVMYLLEAPDETMPAFRDTWSAIGDSIVVVGGDGLWNCHIHTNDIGGAVEAGIDAGRPAQDPHHRPDRTGRRGTVGARGRRARRPRRVRASRPSSPPRSSRSVSGEGIRRLLTSLGVQQVVAGGQSMNPSTAQILEAVELCKADAVIVLPNNKNIVRGRQAGRRAQREAGRGDRDPQRARGARRARRVRPERDASTTTQASMQDALGRVRTGEVTQAVRDAVGRRRAGPRGRLDRARRATGRGRPRTRRGRRGVQAARRARRRRQRDRHRAGRLRRGGQARPSASASTSSTRSRTSRSSSTTAASRCIPISWAWSDARVPTGDPPLTLADLREIPLERLKGVGPALEKTPRRHGAAQRPRPVAALPAALDRPHQEDRHRRARGRGGGDRLRRGAHDPRSPHASRACARRGGRARRHVDADDHVLQPGAGARSS